VVFYIMVEVHVMVAVHVMMVVILNMVYACVSMRGIAKFCNPRCERLHKTAGEATAATHKGGQSIV
jgi:hypothetical protein